MSSPALEAAPKCLEDCYTYIPGGVSSINRIVEPSIAFVRGEGAHIWDWGGKRYVDFHAAFAPFLLGHNHPAINNAVIEAINHGKSLFGSGPMDLEGELASLLCQAITSIDKVTFLNTGSEATALAIRLARAATSRNHFIVIQGSYNGNADELACNVFNTIDEIGPRVCPGEYPVRPMGSGTLVGHQHLVHVVNFNDIESIRYVCKRFPVAAVITEPVLQNIGVVRPADPYLRDLRALADECGFLLIFDEVKTGFRQGLGGYAAIANVVPDLVTYGKAVANGYPIAVLAGQAKLMNLIAAENPKDRPLVAGTYNGHPVAVAAAIATVRLLTESGSEIFEHLEYLGQMAEQGIMSAFADRGVSGSVARIGSAFSFYFMDHCPVDFHDLLLNHDFDRDLDLRRKLIDDGIYFVPIATKQCSISAAHTEQHIEMMIESFARHL